MSTDWWETFQYSAIMVDLRFIINNKMDQKPIWNWMLWILIFYIPFYPNWIHDLDTLLIIIHTVQWYTYYIGEHQQQNETDPYLKLALESIT